MAAGVDINMRPYFDHAATALHWAVIGNQPETATWLLSHGADPTLRDTSFDATPRGWAEHRGREASLAALPQS